MDRQDWIELAVSVGAVVVMLAVMVAVGLLYGDSQGVLSVQGGFALAGAVMFFVFFMVAIGYGLAYFMNPEEDENSDPT